MNRYRKPYRKPMDSGDAMALALLVILVPLIAYMAWSAF